MAKDDRHNQKNKHFETTTLTATKPLKAQCTNWQARRAKVKAMAGEEPIAWLSLLQSKKRLERERGLSQLKELVEGGRLGGQEEREEQVFQLVSSLTCPWEAKHGGLMAAGVLLAHASGEFAERLQGEVLLLLEHDESRIRLATGDCLCMCMDMYASTHVHTTSSVAGQCTV